MCELISTVKFSWDFGRGLVLMLGLSSKRGRLDGGGDNVEDDRVANDGLSAEGVAQVLQEFLEVWTHHVLYTRGLYPSVLFEHCMVYGMSVWMSPEERLRGYIRRALEGAQPWLVGGTLQRVSVVVYDGDYGNRLEAYSIVVHRVQQQPNEASASAWRAFFRDSLFGLGNTCSTLVPLPKGSTWQLEMITQATEGYDEAQWRPLDPGPSQQQQWSGTIKPIKSFGASNKTTAEAFLKIYD